MSRMPSRFFSSFVITLHPCEVESRKPCSTALSGPAQVHLHEVKKAKCGLLCSHLRLQPVAHGGTAFAWLVWKVPSEARLKLAHLTSF